MQIQGEMQPAFKTRQRMFFFFFILEALTAPEINKLQKFCNLFVAPGTVLGWVYFPHNEWHMWEFFMDVISCFGSNVWGHIWIHHDARTQLVWLSHKTVPLYKLPKYTVQAVGQLNTGNHIDVWQNSSTAVFPVYKGLCYQDKLMWLAGIFLSHTH